jgi:hypothetical protein
MDAVAMSTKRKPISRPQRVQITPLAIRLFTEMAAISCTCAPCDGGDEHWGHEECAGCKTWWKLHGRLHQELQCRPWQWPCVQAPETERPYPPGSSTDQNWQPNGGHSRYGECWSWPRTRLAAWRALKPRRAARNPASRNKVNGARIEEILSTRGPLEVPEGASHGHVARLD